MYKRQACYYAEKGMNLYDALCALYEKYGYFDEKVLSKTLAGKEGIAKIQGAVKTVRANAPKEMCIRDSSWRCGPPPPEFPAPCRPAERRRR